MTVFDLEASGRSLIEAIIDGMVKRVNTYIKRNHKKLPGTVVSIIPSMNSLPTLAADLPVFCVITCVHMCCYIERAGNNNMSNHYDVYHLKCPVGSVGD